MKLSAWNIFAFVIFLRYLDNYKVYEKKGLLEVKSIFLRGCNKWSWQKPEEKYIGGAEDDDNEMQITELPIEQIKSTYLSGTENLIWNDLQCDILNNEILCVDRANLGSNTSVSKCF